MSDSQKKTISIFGCGWLGLPLGEMLARSGHFVKGSTTHRDKMRELVQKGIEPYEIIADPDLQGDEDLIKEFFEAEVLIINIPPGRRREDVERHHPRQVAALRAAAEKHGIKFIIFVSSTSVYAAGTGEVTEENTEIPETRSGRALRTAEAVLQASNFFDTTIVRFGGLVGGERNPARFLAGKKDISGADAPVNLIHRDDCLGILQRIIEGDVRGEIFNGVCDEHPTRAEFYVAAAQSMELEPPTFSGERGRGGKIVKNEKVRRVLNYEFKYPDPREMF